MLKKIKFDKHVISVIIFLFIAQFSFGQQKDISLADEYFLVNDFSKAVDIYQKYVLKDDFRESVYENYRSSELQLKEYSSLFKTLKKINKKHPELFLVLVDLLGVEKLGDFSKDYNKDYKRLFNLVKDDAYTLYQVAEHLELRKMYIEYTRILLELRDHNKNNELYAQELIKIYQLTGNTEALIDEVLAYIRRNPQEIETVENLFQSDFKVDDYTLLEQKLFEKIGTDQHYVYRELLVWYYIQQKDFYGAFVQGRSIDIAKRERGYGLFKIANIASSNKSYEHAIEILEYTCEKYYQQEIYVKAKTSLIEIKEIQAKDNYPVDTAQINQLLTDYEELLISAEDQSEKAQIHENQAALYAFYLHDNDKAIELLTKITKTSGISRNRQANAWLLLGDVYLLDDQIGEASLTYFNVENRWKNSIYAEKAKYKNAQLYFYTGEFDLSQSMLDILKRATSREISNDAIDLSIFIKSNSGLDTSYHALQLYSDADLLVYQKKYEAALHTFDELLTQFANHSLTDEVYWQKAKIYGTIKQQDKQIGQLKLLIEKYGDDIWADDAVYLLAQIYEQKGDKKTAMQYYKSILLDYKGSIYIENARLAYRRLRGDGV
jgi:tetratricopeptide (TPR) repeat protein